MKRPSMLAMLVKAHKKKDGKLKKECDMALALKAAGKKS